MPQALVTGGSRGIGAAIVREFRYQGWQVLVPTRLEMDLRNCGSIRNYIGTLSGVSIDALVHSAGVNWPKPLEQITETAWEEILQVNLSALRQLIQSITPKMVEQGSGRILALSSIFSLVSRPGRAAYAASKAAVNALVRTAAIELGPKGIIANSLCPGYIDTDLTRQNNTSDQIRQIATTIPLGRLGTPEEIARLAVFLCSDTNTYLTGQAIVADGGFTCT